MIDKPTVVTSVKGTEYRLEYNGLYYWTNQKGTAPTPIEGGYTNPRDAMFAFNVYNASLEFIASKMEGTEDLESLTSKKDLLGYAEARGIEVPQKYIKQPSSIKKFLQGGYQ